MNFGVPKEVRPQEFRVGLSPAAVDSLVKAGHVVYIEREAGKDAGFADEAYQAVGGQIVYTPGEAWRRADVVVKVARPTAAEHTHFRTGQALLAFLHMEVASPDLLQALEDAETTSIAYEMIQTDDLRLPVLLPTSEVAGRLAPVLAGQLLQSVSGGRGILLTGIPGVSPASVVILGAGIVGTNAARAFAGMGADVTALDKDLAALQRLESASQGRVTTMLATPFNISKAVRFADVLIGAAHIPAERAPIIVSRDMVQTMKPRSVIIDFAIDSGGCIETSRPTDLFDPSYQTEDVIHYCVPNVPALVARTSSYALSNAVLPYLFTLGQHGIPAGFSHNPELARGVITASGRLVHPLVAAALGRKVQVAR